MRGDKESEEMLWNNEDTKGKKEEKDDDERGRNASQFSAKGARKVITDWREQGKARRADKGRGEKKGRWEREGRRACGLPTKRRGGARH